jgi:hypothetical protein
MASRSSATPGFAIEIKPDTELGQAMLIAEDEEGHSEPVAVVASINEAREIAEDDLHRRMGLLESDQDPGLCPYEYKVWARGLDGGYCIATTISVAEL